LAPLATIRHEGGSVFCLEGQALGTVAQRGFVRRSEGCNSWANLSKFHPRFISRERQVAVVWRGHGGGPCVIGASA